MLTLRSYRDYPDAFSGDRGADFLSEEECMEYNGLSFGPGRASWLLSRIATKEMVLRYCDTRLDFVPDPSEVTLIRKSETEIGVKVHAPNAPPVPELRAVFGTSDHYVVSCLREAQAGEEFAIQLKRVHSRYPFAEQGQYASEEWDQVRFAAAEEADRILTGLDCVREALQRVTPEAKGIRIQHLSLKGDCSLTSPGNGAMHAGCWYFDHHVMAVAFAWSAPHAGPVPGARVEEDPVLPESRHSEITL